MSQTTDHNIQAKPKKTKKPSRQQVFTLLVQIGRKDGDGLPKPQDGGPVNGVAPVFRQSMSL